MAPGAEVGRFSSFRRAAWFGSSDRHSSQSTLQILNMAHHRLAERSCAIYFQVNSF
jgi:hypothetical protein